MEVKPQIKNKNNNLTRWRQCISCLVWIKSDSLLFKQLRDGDNVGRDEYHVTMISDLDPMIRTEVDIYKNQTYTHENRGGRGVHHPKLFMGHKFAQQWQGVTKENSMLFPWRDVTTLNATCYNCHKIGRLEFTCSEAGLTDTCSLQVIHSYSQK